MSRRIGAIPDGWVIKRGEEITSKITKGASPKWQGFNYQSDGMLFITSENVRDGFLDISKPKFLPLRFHNKLKNSQLQKGDILINIVGASIGRACIYTSDHNRANINQAVALFRVLPTVDATYVLNYLLFPATITKLLQTQSETARPNLSLTDLKNFPFILPPLPEQRKIAEILGVWDRAIALTEQLIAVKQKRKKALMQQLLTGQQRFVEFKHQPWREIHLGNVASVKRGASPRPIHDPKWFSENGRAWVRISDVTSSPTRFLTEASQYLSPLGEEKSVKVEVGELIMSICATIGVPKIVNVQACIHDGFVIFRDYEKYMDRDFIYHYLNFITTQLTNRGQPGTQKNLNTSIVRSIRVPLLSLAEQRKIAAVLTSCEGEIFLLGEKLAALQHQKKGLMQQLLTGRVRVHLPLCGGD